MNPRPDRDEISSFYDVSAYYTHHDARNDAAESPLSLLERARIKVAWLSDQGVDMDDSWAARHLKPRAKVCDLGCGNGDLLSRLRRLGHEVVGVEPDPDAGDVARGQGVKVVQGTAEELPEEIASQQFDCVVMSHVLEHVRDPLRAVSNATRLLNDNGTLVIETPNNEAKGLRRSGVLWPWLDVPRHLNFFTVESLQAVCKARGLKIKDLEYRGYTRQFDRDWVGTESTIHDVFRPKVDRSAELPSPHRGLHAWRLLLSTAYSPERVKYDSIRVIASRV
jgi:SAM-dependent methyltransferase